VTKNKFRVSAKLWSEERNLTWLLAALIVDMFVLDPLVSMFNRGLAASVINSIALAVVLLLGLLTLTRHKVTQTIFAGITVVIVSVRFGYFVFGEKWLLVSDILLSTASLIAFVVVLLINVYREGPVSRHRMDLSLWIYQTVCFPIYKIPKVKRSDHIIFDRHYLKYLNFLERMNCDYCSYFNGLSSYAMEIAGRTEQYWCPIKHASGKAQRHSREHFFTDYGNAETYRTKLLEIRKQFKDIESN
jgi:hypothetical protein